MEYVTIHGHRRAYVRAGSGPVVLLLHGLGCDHTTWEPVIESLGRRYTVIAPDLLGHGQSAKPRADYSVGGYANGMRDLLTVLGIDKVTVVGHSFGGGVAMQFAYQFPERTERLMLVASGGLGPEVTPGDPGDHHAGLPRGDGGAHAARHPPRRRRRAARRSRRPGWKATRDLDEVAEIFDKFKDPAARHAIRHVVRAVVDWHGQIVTMADRAYLTEEMPMWVVWGRDDRVIPVRHASHAAELAPELTRRGDPRRRPLPAQGPPVALRRIVHDFIRSTEPAKYSRARFRALLKNGPRRPARSASRGR